MKGARKAHATRATAVVGHPVRRKDGLDKVTGAARYIDDLVLPGLLYGTTIRSTISRGEIASVQLDFDTTGFTIVSARDIPGKNVVSLIEADQPSLADGRVEHVGEAILLLAHADKERLLDVRVSIDYRPAAPVVEPELSPTTFKEITIAKGDLGRGFAEADLVVEGEYRTGHQEHLYIETNGVLAVPGDGGITVHGSLQCPYYVHRALCELLSLPERKVRVIQTETGGGFGGKEDYPSVLAGHAALLALKSGRPVKMVYDRAEDMLATTKRHPAIVRHRTGVTRDGHLTAIDIEVLLDGGAYVTLSPVVLSRGLLHATGPYRCDHVRVHGRVVKTNTPPNGAFRGFGAPQTQFAAEVHMDRIGEQLGLDPIQVRERNALRPGDTMATGQRIEANGGALRVLREAVRRTRFRQRRRALRGTDRGLGVALFFHGAGFTGSGEVKLRSKATLELTRRGVRVGVTATEIGQGARTVLAQIVATALGIPYEHVEMPPADTSLAPDSGPTVASRTTMIVGRLLELAARDLKRRLRGRTPAESWRAHGPISVTKEYTPPPGLTWDEEQYVGDAYGTWAWACDVAEVELDRDTGIVRPLRITSVADIGRVIHPVMARGQMEGGTAQAVGYALTEEVVMRDGRMANAQLTNYLIPTTADTPEIDVVFVERPYRNGAFGAKGVGELPMDGGAPAIVNALRSLGADVRAVPATPERVLDALSKG